MSRTHLEGAGDPVLEGPSIKQIAMICNAVCLSGEEVEGPYVYTMGGYSRAFESNLMGIKLRFEVKRDYMENGYTLSYRLHGDGWYLQFVGSNFPPGNTQRGQGHYYDRAFDEVEWAYLCGGNRSRFIFGFKVRGSGGYETYEDSYRREMAILRLMIPLWEVQ
jgi:hypothetical protein